MRLLIVAAAVTLAAFAGCRPGVPVIDTNPRPTTTDGTISGSVSTGGDTAAVAGRRVEAINIATGSRVSATTSATGGFSLKVAPGKYRVVVELRDGESLSRGPGTVDINPSDLDHDIDLVIASAVQRPRQSDTMRGSDGLGSPIA
jgi:hypothetical protein